MIRISVLIVTRNAERYILDCCKAIVNQFPDNKGWELIIVDGMSKDKTCEIAEKYLSENKIDFKIVDNPKYTLATGWNMAVSIAQGEYVVRPDAHAELLEGYIANGIARLEKEPELAAVGGTLITKSESLIGEVIAAVLSNPVGIGYSLFRVGVSKDTYTDTAVYAVYKKLVFKQAGGLNELLTRNQDIDFHKRISTLGFKLMTAADMKAIYHSRSTVSKFLKQGWQNGYWITMGETRHLNHLMPMFFCLFLITLAIVSWKSLLLALAAYFAVVISAYILFSKLFNPIKVILVSVLNFALHITYGAGSIWGLARRLSKK